MNARSPSDTKVTNLRTRLREATATAILAAAEEVFAENGLHATSMNEIATRAGVAVGTLYNHFTDKDALITGLFELRREGMLDVIDEQLKLPATDDFRSQLVRVLTAMIDYFASHSRFYTILWHQEAHAHPAASKQQMLPALYERFEKLTRRGVKDRTLKSDGADFYPAMLMGLMRATGICATIHGGKKVPSPAHLADLFLRGAAA
jgi:AcrR family transcriptional regulator